MNKESFNTDDCVSFQSSAENLAAEKEGYTVVGLGLTGYSCVRHLRACNETVRVCDSRTTPPYLDQLKEEFPDVACELGRLDESFIAASKYMVVSPGLSLDEPAINAAQTCGTRLVSDIDLFSHSVNVPIAAVTGSNGKTTVVSLLAAMSERAGLSTALCGNVGLPVLDAIDEERDLYVIELSSFQLERSEALVVDVAAILNISADHMDRYEGFEQYSKSKHRIYTAARHCVSNRESAAANPRVDVACTSFGLDSPTAENFGVRVYQQHKQQQEFLCQGERRLIAVNDLAIKGSHNVLNALAALAMGFVLGLDESAMLAALREFKALPHRCSWVGDIAGVSYINDSKGTNVGATQAAIEGLGDTQSKRLVLIAGGVGKGADFSVLHSTVKAFVHSVVLFGQDAQLISAALQSAANIELVESLSSAVERSSQLASCGDTVLFSPACASFDMFTDFSQRGDAFIREVECLASSGGGV